MERPSNGLHVELAGIWPGADVLNEGRMASNLQLRIAHLEPQTLALWVLSPHSNREFCVHGIVVHLRLGNCIGYSLREGCSWLLGSEMLTSLITVAELCAGEHVVKIYDS